MDAVGARGDGRGGAGGVVDGEGIDRDTSSKTGYAGSLDEVSEVAQDGYTGDGSLLLPLFGVTDEITGAWLHLR